MALTLILGARRSGKSAVAERLARDHGHDVLYLAPLTANDPEMASRVEAHRARRPPSWQTLETVEIAQAVAQAPAGAVVLLDSLGAWLAEVLWRSGALDGNGDAPATDQEIRRLASLAAARRGDVLVVAEEAGWGPVPPAAATRLWLDRLGDATQTLARSAERVLLVVAGRVLELP
jgi:adenosyl cobinamide kinase/adenosyl cobinamide phosphate guanylyltransferase